MTLTNNTDRGAIDKNSSDVVIPNGNSGAPRQLEGRISRAGAIVKLQLLNLSYDQYHIHTSSNIALVLLRGIKSTPVRIRKTVAFVRRIRNQLTILNNYNRATFEAKGKYPYSKALILLLVRYVQLEYDVLYHSENYSAKYEEEVEGKVRTFLYLLLDGVARKYKRLNSDNTASECVLRVLNQVSTEYKIKGRFIGSLINKLAKKLGLLETISEIRQNGILSQNHPAFQKLSCDSIDNISDCESDDASEIPTSPARSCASPFDSLKLESPKREPPDLDSGQGLKFPIFDDDYDGNSYIHGVQRLKSQQTIDLFGPKSEIVDYSSNGDDYIDLITERVNDKSVQNIDNKDDSNCVAIQSTNEHKICRDVKLNRDDHDVAFGCSVYSNNNRSVTVDYSVSPGNKKNTKRSKDSSASSKASPNRIQNSCEVIDLVDNDDVIEVIELPRARQVPSISANKVEEIHLDDDDDDDCFIIENEEEILNKFNDEQTSEKRATSDNQVNEISSTTGKEELVFHSTDCPDSSSAKTTDFQDGLAEIPVNAFVKRLTDSLRTTSPEIYEKMNQLGQENGQVHALEDLTPETQADNLKATLNQSTNEKCDEKDSKRTLRVCSNLGIMKSTEFLQRNILEEATEKSHLLGEASGSNSIVDVINQPEETIIDQITPVEENTKDEVDVILIEDTIAVSSEINLKSSILEVTTPKETDIIDLVDHQETKENITECIELNRSETISEMNLSSEFELTTPSDVRASNLINNEDIPTKIAEVNKISDEGVESNQLNLSSRLEAITSRDILATDLVNDEIQEIIGEINDRNVDSNQQQAVDILNSLSLPEICLDTEKIDERSKITDEDVESNQLNLSSRLEAITSRDILPTDIVNVDEIQEIIGEINDRNVDSNQQQAIPDEKNKISHEGVESNQLNLSSRLEAITSKDILATDIVNYEIQEIIGGINDMNVDGNQQQAISILNSSLPEICLDTEKTDEELINLQKSDPHPPVNDNDDASVYDKIDQSVTPILSQDLNISQNEDVVENNISHNIEPEENFNLTSTQEKKSNDQRFVDDEKLTREIYQEPLETNKEKSLQENVVVTAHHVDTEEEIVLIDAENYAFVSSLEVTNSLEIEREEIIEDNNVVPITGEAQMYLEVTDSLKNQSEKKLSKSDKFHQTSTIPLDNSTGDPSIEKEDYEDPVKYGNLEYTISPTIELNISMEANESNEDSTSKEENSSEEIKRMLTTTAEEYTKLEDNKDETLQLEQIDPEDNLISDLQQLDLNPTKSILDLHESPIESRSDLANIKIDLTSQISVAVEVENVLTSSIAVVEKALDIAREENAVSDLPILRNDSEFIESETESYVICETATPSPQNNIINVASEDIQLNTIVVASSEDIDLSENTEDKIPLPNKQLDEAENNEDSMPVRDMLESANIPLKISKDVLHQEESNLRSTISSVEESSICPQDSKSEENSKDVSNVSDLETSKEVSIITEVVSRDFFNLAETKEENFRNEILSESTIEISATIVVQSNNYENLEIESNELSFPPIIIADVNCTNLENSKADGLDDLLHLNQTSKVSTSFDHLILENAKEANDVEDDVVPVDNTNLENIQSDVVPENIEHYKGNDAIEPDQINDFVSECTNDPVNLEQVEGADCLTNKNVLPLEQFDKAHLEDVSKDDVNLENVKDADNSNSKDELIEKTTNKSEDDRDIPIELESEIIQNSNTTEIKDGDVNQNASFDENAQEIFLILPTEEIKVNELNEKNEKGEDVFYILDTADCDGVNFVIQEDNITEENQGEYTTEAADASKTSEHDLNNADQCEALVDDIVNFNPKDVEYRYDEDIPTTDSEVCVDYCEFQPNQLECNNEVILGNKEENCVIESVSDVQLCNSESSEVVDIEITSLLADLCVNATNKQNTTVNNTPAIEESTKIDENPDIQDKEHFKLPSFITDDAIILTEPQAVNFENCVRVLEGVEGYSGDVSDDTSLDSDNLEDTRSCEIPPDEIKYFAAMNEFPLEDSFRYPIISERSLEESDDSRILEPDVIIEELNTSYIDHSSNFIDPDSSNSSNFIHSTFAGTEYYNANNLYLPNFIKTELGEAQDADSIIQSKTYRQSLDITITAIENTSSKIEDPYLNLEILATAAAAQKSLKVNPKSALRSRVKMATVKVQKKSAGFQPNEVIETVTKQPVKTVFASATESDFNTVSEDSCDSFAGKLVIAEDHKAREPSPSPVCLETKLEPENVTIFDEDTMDEELSLISTNLHEIDNVDVQITIEESEEFVDVFDEIIKFNTDLDDECDDQKDDIDELQTNHELNDVSVDKAGSSKNSKGKKIGENVKKTVTKIKQGMSHYSKKVPTIINLSQTENSSSKLEPTDDEKSAKRNKNMQKKVPLKSPKKNVGKCKKRIDEPKGLKKIKDDNKALETEIKKVTSQPDEKRDKRLDEYKIIIGQSPMLTHDGEILQINELSQNEAKIMVHNTTTSEVADNLVKFCDDTIVEEQILAGEQSMKQPIRTKAELKAYEKKNHSSDEAATTTTSEDSKLIENKLNLSSYVKLIRDPHMQKLIDKQYEKVAIPKVTLGRKSYKSLIDARKLMFKTHPVHNQVLKNNNILPNIPKIEDGCTKSIAETFQDKKQNLKTNDKSDEELKISMNTSVGSNNKKIDEVSIEKLDQIKEPEEKMKDEAERNPHPELLNKFVITSKIDDLNNQPITVNKIKKEPLPKYRKATRSLSIEISKVVFSETHTESSKTRSSDVEKGKSPKRTQFRRPTRSASVDTKTFEKSISLSSIPANLDKNKMNLCNKTGSESNLAICEFNSLNIDRKKALKSNKGHISDDMEVTLEPINTRRSSREFRRDTLLDRSVTNQDDINFKKAQSKLSAIGTTIEEIIVDQNLPTKKKVANKKPKQKETFAIDSNDYTQKIKVKNLKKGKQKRIQEYYGKKLLKPKRLTNEIDIVPVIVADNKIKVNKNSGGKSKKVNKEKSDPKIITSTLNRKRQAEKDENCVKSDKPEVKKSKLVIDKDNSILIKTDSKSNIETNRKKMQVKKSQLIEKRNKNIPADDSDGKKNVVGSKSKPDKGKANKIEISIKRNIDDTKINPKEKLRSESKNVPVDDSIAKQNVIDPKPKPDKGKINKIEMTAKGLSSVKRNIDDVKSAKEKLCSESKNIPADDSVEKENVVDRKSKTAKGLSIKRNIVDTKTSPIEKLCSKSQNVPADERIEKENVIDSKSKPDKGKINKIGTTAKGLSIKRNIDDTKTSSKENLFSESKNVAVDDSVEKEKVVDHKSKPDKGTTSTIETTAKGLSIKRNIDHTETSPIEKLRSKSKNVPTDDRIEKENVIDSKSDKGKTKKIEATAKSLSIKQNIDDTKTSSKEKICSESKNTPADDSVEKENVVDHKSKPDKGTTNTIELSIKRNIDHTEKCPIEKLCSESKNILADDSVEMENVADYKGKTHKIETTAKALSIKRNIDDTKTSPIEQLCSESKNVPADDSVEKENVINSKSKPDKGETNKIETTAKGLSTKRNINGTETSPIENLCSGSKNVPADDSVEKQNVINSKSKPDKGKTNKIETTAIALSMERNIDDTKTSSIEKLSSESKNIPADDSVEKQNVVNCKSKPDKGKTNKIETTAKALSIKRNIDDTKTTSLIEKLCLEYRNIFADDSVEKQNVADSKGKANKIETTAKDLSIKRNIDDTEKNPIEKLCSESTNVPADDSVEKQNVVDSKDKINKTETTAKGISIKQNIDNTKTTSPIEKHCFESTNVPADDSVEKQNVADSKGKTNKIKTTAKDLSIKRNIDDTEKNPIEKLCSESTNVPADDSVEKQNVVDSKDKINKTETTTKGLSTKQNIDDTKTTSPIEKLCFESTQVPADDSVEKQNVFDSKGKINKIETTAKGLPSIKRKYTEETKTTSPKENLCFESKEMIQKVPDSQINLGKIDQEVVIPEEEIVKVNTQKMDKEINPKSEEKCQEILINSEESIHSQESQKKIEETLLKLPCNNQEEEQTEIVSNEKPEIKKVNVLEIIPSVENELIAENLEAKSMLKTKKDELPDTNIQIEIEDDSNEKEKLLIAEKPEKIFKENEVEKIKISESDEKLTTTDSNSHGLLKEKYIAEDKPEINSICQQHNDSNENIDKHPKEKLNEPHITAMSKTPADDLRLNLNSSNFDEPATKEIGEISREQVEGLNTDIASMKECVKENKSALNVPKTYQIKSIMKKAQEGGVDQSGKKKVTFTIDHIMGTSFEKTIKNETQISTADLDLNSSEEVSLKNVENTQSPKFAKYHCAEPKILNFEQRPLDVMIAKDQRGTTLPDPPKLKRKLFEDCETDSKKQKVQNNPKIEIAKLKRLVKDKLEKGSEVITKSPEFNATSPTKRRDTRKNIDAIINNLRHNLDTKDSEDLLKANKTKISSKWKDSEQRLEVTVVEVIEEDKSRKVVDEVGIEISNDDFNRVREKTTFMDIDGEKPIQKECETKIECSSSHIIDVKESSNAANITPVSQESSVGKHSEMITNLQPAQEEGDVKLKNIGLLKDSITIDEQIMPNDFNSKDRQDTISEEMLEHIADKARKSNVLEKTESKNDTNIPLEIDPTKETGRDKIADDPNVATNYIRDDAMDTVKPLTEKMVIDDITTSTDIDKNSKNSNDNCIKSVTKKLIAEEVKNSSFYSLVTCAPLAKLMPLAITNDSANWEKSINDGNDNLVLSTEQENIRPSNDFINSLQLRRSNHEEINSASSDCVKSLQSENSIVAEVTSPGLTNSANIDLNNSSLENAISEVGANSVVTAAISSSESGMKTTTNRTSSSASDIIFEEKQKKPNDILLNINNNNKSALFKGMNVDPIATDYNDPIAHLDKNLELKCTPDDPAMPDMSISAASQMTNLIQNDVPWPNVAVCNSFLLNDNFEQPTDDPIPAKIFSNPIKDLNVVCSKPIEYSRPNRIDESDKQNISPCKIQDKTVDVSTVRIKDEVSSSSVVCESSELVAMTTEISPFVRDPILATNAGELNSSVSFANVNPENANSVPGKSFDAIDEDQTSLTENVKVYIQITPGTATDHNYSMGGPLLGGKCENTDLPTKQLRAERDSHGSTEGLDNSPVENDSIFSFSEQVNLIENNLTQEKNRSLNQSPIDATADYPFLNQEAQLSSTFMENQDASQQQQDNQISSIDYMKLMNLEQECDSDQDGSITSLNEDFSNPMSVETMNDIQLKHSKFIETTNCMNQPFFPLTGLDLADIEGINDTGITTRPFQYGDDHGNSILKEIKQEQLPEKVTVKINEHDFASTDRIKEINCPENPQLSKDDIIDSVKNEMMSNQHRKFTEKAEDNPPKKTNRDSPLTTFSTAMKAKAMADIERKKSEGKRKEIHSGYPIRQNKKTPVLAPIKTASPPLIKKSPFITDTNSNSSSPIIKSPRRVYQRQSPRIKEETVVPVMDQLAITIQKSPTERIVIDKPKENIKEIVQGKLQDLLSTFSIIKSSNEAPKPPMTKITLDSPTAFASSDMNLTLYDTVKRKRRQPTERLIDKLSLEILVKGNKNQPKQYCKEPNKPKQYGKDQTKTKLDKSVGKHLMDYDDSSLSDEPGKFYKRFKKDDNSDDEFLSKPRPRTEDELSRAFDALQKGDDAPKKTDDAKNYESRGLTVGVDNTKISQIPPNYNLDLKMPTSLHKLPRFYQNKLVPSQPYSTPNVVLNPRYQQEDTYRHYQARRSYTPNPRDLRYSHTRQPSNSKHLSGGAEVSTRRTNSKTTPDLPCRLPPSLRTNVESDWWRNVNAVIKKPPSVIFAADKKQ